MKKKQQPVLTGRNVYKDKKNRTVYYNKREKVGYVITDDKVSKFRILMNRYIIVLLAIILGKLLFELDYLVSIGIGIVVGLILEYQLRKKMLPSLTKLTTFVPEKKVATIIEMSKEASNKIVAMITLLVILSILIVLNGIEQNYDMLSLGICILISVGSLYYASCYIRALMYKKKHQSKS